MASPHDIEFFATERGNLPVQKYLDKLPNVETAAIFAALEDIALNGFDGITDTRQIDGKLWEIKVDQQRIFYAVFKPRTVVLLHAYKKQSGKAPVNEIDTAKKRLSEEQSRR